MSAYRIIDLSLENIDELYNTVSKAWKSKHFKPSSTLDADYSAPKGEKHVVSSTGAAVHVDSTA